MREDPSQTRRSVIGLAGATAISALLAGCGGPGGGDGGNGSGEENDTESAAGNWEDVDSIELEATTDGWIGRAPEAIADETNPTLELDTGREYTITWENGDGEYHNFSIHAVEDEIDGELAEDERLEATELMDGEGDTEELTVEPTAEMQGYVCEMHPGDMIGEISIQEGDGGGTDENGTNAGSGG